MEFDDLSSFPVMEGAPYHLGPGAETYRELMKALEKYPEILSLTLPFDGYGDSGAFEGCLVSLIDNTSKPLSDYGTEFEEIVISYACGVLPGGIEDNEGGIATIVIEAVSGKAEINAQWRTTDGLSRDEVEDGETRLEDSVSWTEV